jgi:hypothetical protein
LGVTFLPNFFARSVPKSTSYILLRSLFSYPCKIFLLVSSTKFLIIKFLSVKVFGLYFTPLIFPLKILSSNFNCDTLFLNAESPILTSKGFKSSLISSRVYFKIILDLPFKVLSITSKISSGYFSIDKF